MNKVHDCVCVGRVGSSASAGAELWALLAEHAVGYRPLLVQLYAMLEAQDLTSIPAASAYLALIQIPGKIMCLCVGCVWVCVAECVRSEFRVFRKS